MALFIYAYDLHALTITRPVLGTMKGTPLALTHLSLLAILVPDYDAGIVFFTQKLGFDLLEDTDMGGGKRWVRVAPHNTQNGAQTEFLLARAVGDQRQAIGAQGGGRVWLFLRSDDFDADFAAMTAKGVYFEEAPRDEPYGMVAVFRDPFGNRWDLLGPAKI